MMARASRPLDKWDMVKIIGLLLMFVDHLGAYFFLDEQWLRAVGRGSAPIFLFLAGYASSYRFSPQLLLLGGLMVISNLLMGVRIFPLNILFTLLLCRGVIYWLEKHGKRIQKPHEWFISLAILSVPTFFVFQYGALGLIFAMCGYMKRRPERYSLKAQHGYLAAALMLHAALAALFLDLNLVSVLLTAPVLSFDYRLLARLEIRPVAAGRYPAWLTGLLTFSSRYSGYIYAIHLIIISWITQYPI